MPSFFWTIVLGLNLIGHYLGADFGNYSTSYNLYLFVKPAHTQSVGLNTVDSYGHIVMNQVTGRWYKWIDDWGIVTGTSHTLGETSFIQKDIEYGVNPTISLMYFNWNANRQNDLVVTPKIFGRIYSSQNKNTGLELSFGPSFYMKGTHPVSLDINLSMFMIVELWPSEPEDNYTPKEEK